MVRAPNLSFTAEYKRAGRFFFLLADLKRETANGAAATNPHEGRASRTTEFSRAMATLRTIPFPPLGAPSLSTAVHLSDSFRSSSLG